MRLNVFPSASVLFFCQGEFVFFIPTPMRIFAYSVLVLIDDISDVHRGAIPRLSIVLYSDLISLSLSLSLSLVP